jgi:hypothetical protein
MTYQCPKCGRVHDSSAGDVAAPLQIQARPPLYAQPSMASQLVSPWDRSMAPVWAGSYLAYWSMRVDAYMQYLASMAPGPSSWNVYVMASQCRQRPDYWDIMSRFLRQWPSPADFEAQFTQQGLVPTPSVPGMWFAKGDHDAVAFLAAQNLAKTLCALAGFQVG